MIEDQLIREALQPPEGWTDTPEQAQLRSCLTEILLGHDAGTTIRICYDIITIMRDQLSTGTAHIRRAAAKAARENGIARKDLVAASGQTPATISRLLNESRDV
jgi:hypothetical protein